MLEHESERHSFFWLNNIPLHIYTFCSSIHCWTPYCLCLLAIVNNATMNISVQVSESLLSILLGVSLGVDHSNFTFNFPEKPPKGFSTVAESFYNPTRVLHILFCSCGL